MKRYPSTITMAWANALRALALGLVSLMVHSCVEEGDFECKGDHARCESGKGQGICQPSGFCSYKDSTCRETHQRYSPFAGNFARKCVTLANAGDGDGDGNATDTDEEDSLGSSSDTGTTSTSTTSASTTTTTTSADSSGSSATSDSTGNTTTGTDASTTN